MKTINKKSKQKIQALPLVALTLALVLSPAEEAAAQTKARIQGIDHVGINVPDLKSAITFFSDVLGFTPVTQIGPLPLDAAWKELNHINPATGEVTIKMVNAGTGASIEVFEYANNKGNNKQPNTDDIGASHIAFYTSDIKAAVEYLKSKNVRILGEPFATPSGDTEGETWVYFESPWGSKMELVSYPNGKGYEKNNPKTVLWSPKNNVVNSTDDFDADKNKALVEKHFQIWNETDNAKRVKLLNQVYAQDIEMTDRHFIATGQEEINKFVADLQKQHPGSKFTTRSVQMHHNIVRLFWQSGTKSKPDAVTGMDLFVIENGKVKKLYVFVDETK